jgi:4-aminobutyrate---pyruvate transaminase
VRDKASKAPFDASQGVAALVTSIAQNRGLIVRPLAGDTIAFCPPLIVSEAEIDEIWIRFNGALEAAADRLKLAV